LLLEIGLLLVLIPWSSFWDRNYFAHLLPTLQDAIANNYIRGAVSGLGLLNLYSAVAELTDLFRGRAGDDRVLSEPHGS
jgi:hypothetical protein